MGAAKGEKPKFDTSIYKNCYPHAATYVGTYQPLLGWSSRLTRVWVNRKLGRAFTHFSNSIGHDIAKANFTVYGGNVAMAPAMVFDEEHRWLRRILLADKGASLQKIAASLDAAKPQGHTGATADKLKSKEADAALKGKIRDAVKSAPLAKKSLWSKFSGLVRKSNSRIDLERQQQSAQIILNAAKEQSLFAEYLQLAMEPRKGRYDKAAWWADQFMSLGWWKTVKHREFVVSPVGLLDLFRHYYYDFGSFLGPPVEHLWVPPYTTTEFTEVSSRTEYKLRESETTVEMRTATEVSQTEASELADEVQRQTQEDFRTGITGEGGVQFAVWHAGGTSELEYGTSVQNSQRTARKTSKETTTKAVTEMRNTSRTLTRQITETRNESSRRHKVENDTANIVNYELRRKYQRIGVELQHLGTQLCWQLYVDEPGKDLGLAELVHVAKPEDFDVTPPADLAPPTFTTLDSDFQFTIPFKPLNGKDGDDNGDYIDGDETGGYDGGTNIETDFYFRAPAPQFGYELAGVTERSFDRTTTDHDAPSLWTTEYSIEDRKTGEFKCYLAAVNFEKQPAVKVTVRLLWEPAKAIVDAAMAAYTQKVNAFEQKVQRQAEEALVDALRERIEYARSVRPRSSDDLREEERTALYRRVIERLLGEEMAGTPHLASELMRTFFEFDRMLYFVAPDWWNPRMQKHRGGLTVPEIFTPQGGNKPVPLGNSQRVRFDREQDSREDNYLITESSDAAPLGSSIGWMLQLDGDRHRNAFLNCAWAKVVIPIARGREKKALDWLLQAEVEGVEGLDATYLDKDGQPIAKQGGGNMTVREKLLELVDKLTADYADPDAGFLATQTVFETGFNPMAGGFQITGKPFERFAQWTEILPTNQVVPVPYVPPPPCGSAGN